jgi:hypothetical protein
MTLYSPANIALVEASLTCACHPDSDTVKTYAGWKEFGRQVSRGERAVCSVPTFIPIFSKEDPDKIVGKRPWTAHLFCECQTAPVKENQSVKRIP